MTKIPLNEKYMYILVRGDIRNMDGWPMPDGMAAAQAAHAAAKLVALNIMNKKSTANDFVHEDFTKIVLRCRDDKEIEHVLSLANKRGILSMEMFDTNISFYGVDDNGKLKAVRTAIAFGPEPKNKFVGICDYLPLW